PPDFGIGKGPFPAAGKPGSGGSSLALQVAFGRRNPGCVGGFGQARVPGPETLRQKRGTACRALHPSGKPRDLGTLLRAQAPVPGGSLWGGGKVGGFRRDSFPGPCGKACPIPPP